jgi:hypothetical protein
MRRLFAGFVAIVVGVGVSLAVVGCDSSSGNSNDKMNANKMGSDMSGDNMMNADKMSSGKMGDKI